MTDTTTSTLGRQLRKPLQAVILDWAGTTVDYGSRAPAQVFVEIFRRKGIEITAAEAREPMGRAKREHIATICGFPRVSQLWRQQFGSSPAEADIDAMYHEFLPLQKQTLAALGADVIPGVAEGIEELRSMGLKIGSTTGYTRELMEVVVPLAARQGYSPDVIVCADDVPCGRPAPWMNFLAAQKLGVYPMETILVVDDTVVGIKAGINSGAITVAVTRTGNLLGLSEKEVSNLRTTELQSRLSAIETEFQSIGADYVMPSVADLPALLK